MKIITFACVFIQYCNNQPSAACYPFNMNHHSEYEYEFNSNGKSVIIMDWEAVSALSWLHNSFIIFTSHRKRVVFSEFKYMCACLIAAGYSCAMPSAHTHEFPIQIGQPYWWQNEISFVSNSAWLVGRSFRSPKHPEKHGHAHAHTYVYTHIKQIPNGARWLPVMPKGRRTRRKYILAGRKYTFRLKFRSPPSLWLQLDERGWLLKYELR